MNKSTYSFLAGAAFDTIKFKNQLCVFLRELKEKKGQPVFLCIGTDRSTGDSLGPLIGHFLNEQFGSKLSVYGTLHYPVHALNLNTSIQKIFEVHKESPIVAIDAALGQPERVGNITLSRHSIRPGLGVNKSLPDIGDISITGIIGTTKMSDPVELQSVRLSLVMDMALNISRGIALIM